jgi:hypothetical protein
LADVARTHTTAAGRLTDVDVDGFAVVVVDVDVVGLADVDVVVDGLGAEVLGLAGVVVEGVGVTGVGVTGVGVTGVVVEVVGEEVAAGGLVVDAGAGVPAPVAQPAISAINAPTSASLARIVLTSLDSSLQQEDALIRTRVDPGDCYGPGNMSSVGSAVTSTDGRRKLTSHVSTKTSRSISMRRRLVSPVTTMSGSSGGATSTAISPAPRRLPTAFGSSRRGPPGALLSMD